MSTIAQRITTTRRARRSPAFNPFWEFVAGPAHAGTFGANELDKTFGPEVRFLGVPKDMKPNRSPSRGVSVLWNVEGGWEDACADGDNCTTPRGRRSSRWNCRQSADACQKRGRACRQPRRKIRHGRRRICYRPHGTRDRSCGHARGVAARMRVDVRRRTARRTRRTSCPS